QPTAFHVKQRAQIRSTGAEDDRRLPSPALRQVGSAPLAGLVTARRGRSEQRRPRRTRLRSTCAARAREYGVVQTPAGEPRAVRRACRGAAARPGRQLKPRVSDARRTAPAELLRELRSGEFDVLAVSDQVPVPHGCPRDRHAHLPASEPAAWLPPELVDGHTHACPTKPGRTRRRRRRCGANCWRSATPACGDPAPPCPYACVAGAWPLPALAALH